MYDVDGDLMSNVPREYFANQRQTPSDSLYRLANSPSPFRGLEEIRLAAGHDAA